MKKIAILSFIFIGFLIPTTFAQDVKVKEDKMKIKDKDDKTGGVSTGKYKADYSSNFQIGNPANVQKIIDMWQDWDDNMLDRHDYVADTITMFFSDGTTVRGKAENFAEGKKYRSSLASVKTDLHAVVPLRSIDRNEDAVAIWGMETNTHPDGKVVKREIHEVWFFNKDGKISTMRSWHADVKP